MTEIKDNTEMSGRLVVLFDANDSLIERVVRQAVANADAGAIWLLPLRGIEARRLLGAIAEDPLHPVYLIEASGRIIAGLANVRHRLLPTEGDPIISRIRQAYRRPVLAEQERPLQTLTKSPFVRWGE